MNQEYEKCELSEKGKCIHSWSEGELNCNGSEKEKCNCLVYSESDT